MSNLIKLHLVGNEFFHADGRTDRWTDMTKLIVAFRNFAYAPKIVRICKRIILCFHGR
jgi:hypothetical protein